MCLNVALVPDEHIRSLEWIDVHEIATVSVRPTRSDGLIEHLIMSIVDNGHLEAVYGGQKGSEEAVLVG